MDDLERVINDLRRQREIMAEQGVAPTATEEILQRIAALNERMNRNPAQENKPEKP